MNTFTDPWNAVLVAFCLMSLTTFAAMVYRARSRQPVLRGLNNIPHAELRRLIQNIRSNMGSKRDGAVMSLMGFLERALSETPDDKLTVQCSKEALRDLATLLNGSVLKNGQIVRLVFEEETDSLKVTVHGPTIIERDVDYACSEALKAAIDKEIFGTETVNTSNQMRLDLQKHPKREILEMAKRSVLSVGRDNTIVDRPKRNQFVRFNLNEGRLVLCDIKPIKRGDFFVHRGSKFLYFEATSDLKKNKDGTVFLDSKIVDLANSRFLFAFIEWCRKVMNGKLEPMTENHLQALFHSKGTVMSSVGRGKTTAQVLWSVFHGKDWTPIKLANDPDDKMKEAFLAEMRLRAIYFDALVYDAARV